MKKQYSVQSPTTAFLNPGSSITVRLNTGDTFTYKDEVSMYEYRRYYRITVNGTQWYARVHPSRFASEIAQPAKYWRDYLDTST